MPHLILVGLDDINLLKCWRCRADLLAFIFSEIKLVLVERTLYISSGHGSMLSTFCLNTECDLVHNNSLTVYCLNK